MIFHFVDAADKARRIHKDVLFFSLIKRGGDLKSSPVWKTINNPAGLRSLRGRCLPVRAKNSSAVSAVWTMPTKGIWSSSPRSITVIQSITSKATCTTKPNASRRRIPLKFGRISINLSTFWRLMRSHSWTSQSSTSAMSWLTKANGSSSLASIPISEENLSRLRRLCWPKRNS